MSLTKLSELEDRMAEIQARIKVDRAKYDASVKVVADKMSYPLPNYRPTMASFIHKASVEDECVFYIVYGPLRYGKTAYACKTLASLYGTWDPEILRNFIVFKPTEFLELIRRPVKTDFKWPAFLWDDAGVWLSALQWEDPLLKSICEYMNVVGTHFAGVIMTSPLPTYVIKKIRGMPSCANVRIYKTNMNPSKPRTARGYYQWLAPDMKKSGVKPFIDDKFSAVLPTTFFNWYKEYRKGYNNQIFAQLEKKLYDEAQADLKDAVPHPVSAKVHKAVEGEIGEEVWEESSESNISA